MLLHHYKTLKLNSISTFIDLFYLLYIFFRMLLQT